MDKIIRMRLDTYQRIRREFKGLYKESLADYFERLSKHLKERKPLPIIEIDDPNAIEGLRKIWGRRR